MYGLYKFRNLKKLYFIFYDENDGICDYGALELSLNLFFLLLFFVLFFLKQITEFFGGEIKINYERYRHFHRLMHILGRLKWPL